MTNDPLEELRKLSNQAAKENAYLNARPQSRSLVMNFEGDIPSDGLARVLVPRQGYDDKDVLRITVRNAIVTKSVSAIEASSFTIDIGAPGSANDNSEFGQMQLSLEALNPAYKSLIDLAGCHIAVEERVHKFKGQQDTGKPLMDDKTGLQAIGRNGKPRTIWEERVFNVFYYHILSISGRGVVAGSAQTAEVGPISDGVLADALVYAMEHTEDELGNIPQTLKGLQDKGIDFSDLANTPLSEAVMNNTLNEYLEKALPSKSAAGASA